MHVAIPQLLDSASCISSIWFGSSGQRCTRTPEGLLRGNSPMAKMWNRAAHTTAAALCLANAQNVPA